MTETTQRSTKLVQPMTCVVCVYCWVIQFLYLLCFSLLVIYTDLFISCYDNEQLQIDYNVYTINFCATSKTNCVICSGFAIIPYIIEHLMLVFVIHLMHFFDCPPLYDMMLMQLFFVKAALGWLPSSISDASLSSFCQGLPRLGLAQ